MNNLAFSKINYLIIGASVLIIILGFVLMHGSTTVDEFNPDVFSFRRITLAPVTCMVGFVGVIFGIMWRSKDKA